MQYFESLVDQLTKRAARATLGQFGLRSKPLREFCGSRFLKRRGRKAHSLRIQFLKPHLVGNLTPKQWQISLEGC